MINFEAAKVAIEQVTIFDAKNLTLLPVQMTPVAEIFNTIGTRYANNTGGNEYRPDPTLIEFQSCGSSDTMSQTNLCTATLDAMSSDIYREASRHMSFTKNNVAEIIRQVGASIQAHIDRIPGHTFEECKIVEKELPTPVYEMSDDISKFDGTPYLSIVGRIPIGKLNAGEIYQYLTTGNADIDAQIDAWVKLTGDELIEKIWMSVFSAEQTNDTVDSWLRNPIHATDAATLFYLASSHLMANIPEDIPVTLTEYRKFLTNLLGQSAAALNHAMDDEAQNTKSERLIYNNVGTIITVNKKFYKEWLSRGGNVEAIYGNSLIEVPYMYAKDIDVNASKLIDVWRNHTRLISTGEGERKAYMAMDCIIDAVDDVVVSNFNMCFSHICDEPDINKNHQAYLNYKSRFDQYMKTFNFDEYSKDPWGTTIDICLTCIYPEVTSAKAIMYGITKAKQDNPNLSTEDCTLISNLMYICEYIGDQIFVS